jgi:putative ABC transport system permease protein
MFLAIKEMRRAKVRFGLLIASVGLLVFLILFQQSLQNGLLTSFVGAIRNQSAPVLVYSVDGQRVIQGSIITPDLEQQVRNAAGVGAAGRIAQGTFTVTAADGEQYDTTLLGYDDRDLGAPRELIAGR